MRQGMLELLLVSESPGCLPGGHSGLNETFSTVYAYACMCVRPHMGVGKCPSMSTMSTLSEDRLPVGTTSIGSWFRLTCRYYPMIAYHTVTLPAESPAKDVFCDRSCLPRSRRQFPRPVRTGRLLRLSQTQTSHHTSTICRHRSSMSACS